MLNCNAVTEEFYKWITMNESEYESMLTDELKIRAFKMILEKRMCLNTINTIVNIFKCNTNLDFMEGLIRESIRQKKFKEVNYWYSIKSIYFMNIIASLNIFLILIFRHVMLLSV
jgi:hypothetical protein